MPHGSERRQQERTAIELKVEYQRLNTFFYDYTKNISKGGTFIKTKRPLDEGTLFLFKLVVPRLDEPLVLRGEVRWVRRDAASPETAGDDTAAGMGIRFVWDDDEQRQRIERTVEKMMVESLGQLIYSRLRAES